MLQIAPFPIIQWPFAWHHTIGFVHGPTSGVPQPPQKAQRVDQCYQRKISAKSHLPHGTQYLGSVSYIYTQFIDTFEDPFKVDVRARDVINPSRSDSMYLQDPEKSIEKTFRFSLRALSGIRSMMKRACSTTGGSIPTQKRLGNGDTYISPPSAASASFSVKHWNMLLLVTHSPLWYPRHLEYHLVPFRIKSAHVSWPQTRTHAVERSTMHGMGANSETNRLEIPGYESQHVLLPRVPEIGLKMFGCVVY